jgi:hypothetical protein
MCFCCGWSPDLAGVGRVGGGGSPLLVVDGFLVSSSAVVDDKVGAAAEVEVE